MGRLPVNFSTSTHTQVYTPCNSHFKWFSVSTPVFLSTHRKCLHGKNICPHHEMRNWKMNLKKWNRYTSHSFLHCFTWFISLFCWVMLPIMSKKWKMISVRSNAFTFYNLGRGAKLERKHPSILQERIRYEWGSILAKIWRSFVTVQWYQARSEVTQFSWDTWGVNNGQMERE